MLTIPGFFESYRSLKDKTLKLVFETQEPTPDQIASIQAALMKSGFMAFHSDPFTNKQLDELKSIQVEFDDPTKTPSKRLRAVLFLNWKQKNEGYSQFHDYYIVHMERIIDHFKEKLD